LPAAFCDSSFDSSPPALFKDFSPQTPFVVFFYPFFVEHLILLLFFAVDLGQGCYVELFWFFTIGFDVFFFDFFSLPVAAFFRAFFSPADSPWGPPRGFLF